MNLQRTMPDGGRKQCVRRNIDAMHGYVPGEQPRGQIFIKLNTNENPYPPSPRVAEALAAEDLARLRLYPDPAAQELRAAIASQYGLTAEQVICGNGSDDLLTIAIRTCVDQNGAIAYPEPSYSLYPVLADVQGARKIAVALEVDKGFQLPPDAAQKAADASLFLVARPNAPTGNAFPLAQMRRLAGDFDGVLFIDEAYADFADDNCLELVKEFPNVIVSRTLSKSYSLAGIRLGFAFASPGLISQMFKVKDSYNVNMLSQTLALAAIRDQATFKDNIARIRNTRERVRAMLDGLDCEILPSQANFLFVKPPLSPAIYVQKLRETGILVRYFPGEYTGDYVRITIGTDQEMEALISATRDIIAMTGGQGRAP